MIATWLTTFGLLVCGAAFAAGPELYCADQEGNPHPPTLTVKAGGGHTLFVCAVSSKKRKRRLEVSGFKIFQVGKTGKKREKPLFEKELALQKYAVAAKGEELLVDELISNGKELVPGFEVALTCDEKNCRASAPTCVFEKPKAGTTRVLDQISDYTRGKRLGKVPPRKLIDSLATLALSGDATAAAIFQNRGKLVLDGEASDAYFDHQETLDRLKKAGCL